MLKDVPTGEKNVSFVYKIKNKWKKLLQWFKLIISFIFLLGSNS